MERTKSSQAAREDRRFQDNEIDPLGMGAAEHRSGCIFLCMELFLANHGPDHAVSAQDARAFLDVGRIEFAGKQVGVAVLERDRAGVDVDLRDRSVGVDRESRDSE